MEGSTAKTTKRIALCVAVGLDAIQLGLFPLLGEGFVSPASDVLDCLAFGFFWWLIGWHLALLPSLVIKVIPMIDLAPTWTIAVLIATRSRKDPPPVSVTPAVPPVLPAHQNDNGTTLHAQLISPEPDRQSPLKHWRWPLTIITVALIAAITVLSLWKSCTLATGLHLDRKLTTEFIASIPEVQSAGLGRLELATARATETFSRSDFTEFQGFYLGTTYVEMRVPVTYRYHLELADPWQLYVDKNICIVKAPVIRASLPPAIQTDGIERLSENGWALFNKNEAMENLEKDVTPTLIRYASDKRHIKLVREDCRKTVANFVRAFLLRSSDRETSRLTRIIVIFYDEPFTDTESLPPTIQVHPAQ